MALTRLEVQVKLAAPLIIGGGRSFGTFNETLLYLPGAALRGAVAEILLARSDHAAHSASAPWAGCAFCAIFDDGAEPIFENLYPSETGKVTQPLPLTAQTCKRQPGFPLLKPRGTERHGVYDVLVQQFWFEEALKNGWRVPFVYQARCPKCHAEMKPFGGFFGEGEVKYYRARATSKRVSRTAINRQRSVAQDGMLYTLEVMDSEVTGYTLSLNASVWVEENKRDALTNALTQVHRIGMGKSRGLGEVTVQVKPPKPSLAPLRERLDKFNALMRQEGTFYRKMAGMEMTGDAEWFFTADLIADALLTEKGLPVTHLCPEALGLPEGEITLARWWAKHRVAGGWFAAAGLPRRTELATVMGSVFLYRVRNAPLDALVSALESLEQRGIGNERSRGFGQIVVCSPFHQEVA